MKSSKRNVSLLAVGLCLLVSTLVSTLVSAFNGAAAAPTERVFRFSLSVEPNGADPARISSSESNYFLVNVLRGLYFVDAKGFAQPEIAEACTWVKSFSRLRCELKNAKWSDGKKITAQDFVESWQRLLAPKTKGFGFSILSGVVNAEAVFKGSMPAEKLGVRAVSESVLEITLAKDDREFTDRLAHPALVATRTGFKYDRENAVKAPFSGPYKIADWSNGARIKLKTNEQYETIQKNGVQRPPVEILTIDDDETAFNLYREGTLTLLRRLPTHYFKDWNQSPQFFQIPAARFDYLGFGPKLRREPDFRDALAHSLNFQELKQIYSALGIPGCPSIEPAWMEKVPCIEFNLARAKAAWQKVPAELKSKRWTISFSKQGGDDVQKGMEWMQGQWKKNLGLSVELKPFEQSVYMSTLKNDTPDIFRKGVGLDRSTCLAAVEIFSRDDSENFIKLDLADYESAIMKLRMAKTEPLRKSACTEVVQLLVDRSEVIPLGRIHFMMLAKPEFSGWVVNPLNHLDLSRLRTGITN